MIARHYTAGIGLCLLIVSALLSATVRAETPLYLDTAQPVEARVKDLISRLTLEEKAILLNHRGPDIERFGIKSDKWNQCFHGVWWTEPTTMFPVSIAMAATWDPALIRQVADTISDEARGIYNGWHQDPGFKGEKKGLIYRAPVINISRNPSVSFQLPASQFSFYDITRHDFTVEPGIFNLMVGSSSADTRLKSDLHVSN